MSRKDEIDCPTSEVGSKSSFNDNPASTMGNPLILPKQSQQYFIRPTVPMATLSTNTTTVPSGSYIQSPISSPTRSPPPPYGGSSSPLSDNPMHGKVKFQIMRRKTRMLPNPKKAHSIEMRIIETRETFTEIYLSGAESEKREFCRHLIDEDAPINTKYKELDLDSLLKQNLVQSRVTYLVQALGIQEKYASNLIKDVRPQFWRTVKFTSSLWKTYLENINGSVEILMKMGYTKRLKDGLSFPDDINEPDIVRVKEIAADLYLAKIETDDLIQNRHPYYVIASSQREASSGPSKEKIRAPTGKEISTSEDSDSEYEDAKDGLSNEDDTISAQQVPVATLKQAISSPPQECFVCGEKTVAWFCKDCKEHFCQDCDVKFHSRHDRKNHDRQRFGGETPVTTYTSTSKSSGDEIVSPTMRKHENIVSQRPSPTRLEDDGIKTKKPVPKPRKRIPSKTTRVSSPGSMTTSVSSPDSMTTSLYSPGRMPITKRSDMANSPSVEKLPPPIPSRTIQSPTNFNKNVTKSGSVIKEKVPQQPSIHTIEREILRPPNVAEYEPMKEPLKVLLQSQQQEEPIYESLKNPENHIYETLDHQSKDPPPLPPKPPKRETTTAPVYKGATTCPYCYCLNTSDTVRCNACGRKLLEQSAIPAKSPHRHEEQGVIHDPWQSVSHPIVKPQGTVSPFSKTVENPLYFNSTPQAGIAKTPSPDLTTTSSEPKWACEFCTFLNPMDKTICDMCAKTKSEGARVVEPSPAPSKSPITPEPMSILSPSLAVKLQEDELKLTSEALRTASQSKVVQSLQKKEEELLQTKVNDHKQLYNIQQGMLGIVSPTLSYPSVFSSSSEGQSPELLKTSKEMYVFRRETSYKEIREARESGQEFVRRMKEAESKGFSAEELNIAYTLSVDDPQGPVHWLQTKWLDLIHKVMIKFTDHSKKEDIGNLSPEEARQALIERTGDVERAVELSIEERKKGLQEVMNSGFYPRIECVSALDSNDGDVSKSIQDLQVMSFQPMLQRIWDTCLADDADGNEEWYLRRNPDRQLSTSHDDELFEAMVSNKELDRDRRIRVIYAEKKMISWGRAETAIRLIDANFPVLDSVEAAQAVGDFDRAKQFLQRECIVCADFKSESQMVTMLNCQCRFCRDCVKQYVTTVIQEQNIMKLVCPDCGEPNNLDNDIVATEYFNNLDIMIRRIVDEPTHDLFQRKLRDRTLMKEPNFRWCSHCSSGFINERPDLIKMACPNCRKYTCFKCKKQWEDQHEGITCEQFAAWKTANDPEAQAHGLAAHLKENGIECPNCKFRYDLAKGGCMHFKCNQCSHEFCSGCYQPFRQGNHCPVSNRCAGRGLHAHHPRDCLFFLRDREPEELKKLLDEHNVQYNTEPPQRPAAGAVNHGYQEGEESEVQGAAAAAAGGGAAADVGRCNVMEQRETGNGLQDVECGRETPAGYAGLCRLHFKEYLVEKINANLIDPLGMFDINDLEVLINRNDQEPPARKSREKDGPFRERLVQFVQAHFPLPNMPPRRRVLNIDEAVAEDQVHLILNEEERDGPPLDRFAPDVQGIVNDALVNDGFDGVIQDDLPDDDLNDDLFDGGLPDDDIYDDFPDDGLPDDDIYDGYGSDF
ncbi:E3 ubiquitin-protein ligase RNF31-like [Actinia tenebrosa]|uniref:RanBP-type and C3HC4-type zinc finger-containing protein 1 n=1 Tax=Actinia tenebrosa TaxID=6105 RepID=A0A6P8IU05_ACTTE|nr:E3 ubiquitin-protein ligase RNF31-like [Actinia tenebrosa]